MKKLGILLTVIVMTLQLTGCSNNAIITEETKDEVTISLSWWGDDLRHEYTMKSVKEFEKKYPYIKVKFQYGEYTGFENRMDVKMAAHTEADVMQINYPWIEKYSKDGEGFYDLNQLSDIIELDKFPQDFLNFAVKNGKLNGIPTAMNTKVLFYNGDLFKKYNVDIPKTWDELFASGAKFSQEGDYPMDLDINSVWFLAIAYTEQMTGRVFFEENNTLGFNKEDVKMMVEFYFKLVDLGVGERLENRKADGFDTGVYGGTFQWLSAIDKYGDKVKKLGQNYAIGDLLTNGTESYEGYYSKPATLYAISKNTSHPKEAALLLNFLLNDKAAVINQALEKGIPNSTTAQEILKEEGLLTGAQYEAYQKLEQSQMKQMNPYFENADLVNTFKAATDSVSFGKSSVDEASQTAYESFVQTFQSFQ